ncbi:MAG: hypothetical protein KDA61_08775 [Planctomycetales bacterium]|nr:hypothetical protein [Planctomycetales bacterium]
MDRFEAQRVLHGVRRNFVVFQRAVQLIGVAQVKIARDGRLEKVLQVGTLVAVRLRTRLDVVAHGAANAVASQRSVVVVGVAGFMRLAGVVGDVR